METKVAAFLRHAALQSGPLTDTSRLTGWGSCRRIKEGASGEFVKFNLIDKIEQLSDERIVGVKYVSLAEEYLADHFPTFPVLPGVMMLEAVTQASSWLLHHRTGFSNSICVLREARNVKYGTFVAPGNFLRVEAELVKMTEGGATFKASGTVGADSATPAAQAVQLRVELACFNLADRDPLLADIDQRLREHNRRRWELIRPQTAVGALSTTAAAAS